MSGTANAPINAFVTGQSNQVVLIGPFGRIDLATVTEFTAKQETTLVSHIPMNGKPVFQHLPKGWSGTFTYDRANATGDRALMAFENAFYNGGNLSFCTVYQYVTETDGSTTTIQYNGATLNMSNAGQFSGDKIATGSVEFTAADRQVL